MVEDLSAIERAVFELISRAGEIMAKDVPPKMAGAIPSLKHKGLVEVLRRPASLVSRKKQTYLRVKEPEK
ncbi:MAG: hypothetical protein PVH79_04940 [Candidatus Bathyarchaeota archaeon]